MAFLNVKEVAAKLEISTEAVNYQIEKGRIPVWKRSKPRLIDERCLDYVALILREHNEKQAKRK